MSQPLPFERRAVTSLASLYAFRMLGLFMVLPVLSLYGQQYQYSTPLLIGVALGGYGFTQALLQIPFGIWSDRWGRKQVIAVGLVLFALGSMVAAQADNIYELILGRCLQGGGAIASAIMALVADLTQDENRTKAMAMIGASIGLSFSVALALGPLVSTYFGLSGVFWLTALLAVVGIFILIRWVPTPSHCPNSRAHRDAAAVPDLLWKTLRNTDLMRLNVGIFSLHFILMSCFIVLPILLEQLGLARTMHWQVYLGMSVFAFVLMVPFIIVAEKKRQMKTVFIGSVITLVATMLFMEAAHAWLAGLLAGLFLFFTAFNLLEATLPSLMSKTAPAGSKGTASGIYSTSQFLGAFAGGVTGGWMLQEYGPTAVFWGAAAVALLWLMVAVTMRSPRYLTSIQVALSANLSVDDFVGRVEALPGVAEVVVIEEEQSAYLKVDNHLFDRAKMQSALSA